MSTKPVLLHFKFDNFANLHSEVGRHLFSEEQTDCNGNKWKLKLFPGGVRHRARNAMEECYVGVYLCSGNQEDIYARSDFCIYNAGGEIYQVKERETSMCEFKPMHNQCSGHKDFVKRSDVLNPATNLLWNGALCIGATIQVRQRIGIYDKKDLYRLPKTHSQKMLKLLKSEEDADVSFLVGTKTFLAHNIIVLLVQLQIMRTAQANPLKASQRKHLSYCSSIYTQVYIQENAISTTAKKHAAKN